MKKLTLQLFALLCLMAVQGYSTVQISAYTAATQSPAMSGTFALSAVSGLGSATNIDGIYVLFTATNQNPAGHVDQQNAGCYLSGQPVTTYYPLISFANYNSSTSYAWMTSPPSPAVITSPNCSITTNTVSMSKSGATANLQFTVDFPSNFVGLKYVWAYANPANQYPYESPIGWQYVGTWTVGQPPAVLPTTSANPSSSSASRQVFTFSTTGTGVTWLAAAIGTWMSADGCSIQSSVGSGTVLLYNDSGGWSAAPTSNSHCQINSASVSTSGNTYSMTVDISAFGVLYGSRIITVSGLNSVGYGTGTFGTWTIPMIDMSLTATEINTHEMLMDDATGQFVERPTSSTPYQASPLQPGIPSDPMDPMAVRLTSGQIVHIPPAYNVKVGKISSTWEPVGAEFNYHFKIDTTDNPYIMRLGITEDRIIPFGSLPTTSYPEGWASSGDGMFNIYGKAKLSEESEFSVQSAWRPGLQVLFVMSHDAKKPIPSFASTEDNMRIVEVANIFSNSLRKFVIGPAIDPAITPDGMKDLVTRWVEDYGFKFLKPILDGKSPSELESPEGGFEQEVLKCLIAAWPSEAK